MNALHLVKLGLLRDRLMNFARARGLDLRSLDESYAVHCATTELWHDDNKQSLLKPFWVEDMRAADAGVLAYSELDEVALKGRLADSGASAARDCVKVERVESIPEFKAGLLAGFKLRACPVERTKLPGRDPEKPLARVTSRTNKRERTKSRELDEWLAACLRAPGQKLVREAVYRGWLEKQLNGSSGEDAEPWHGAVKLRAFRIAGYQRERLQRRDQRADGDGKRRGHVVERPDVHMEGVIEVLDAARFRNLLARGVGRHRSFGFGMLVLTPPRIAC